MHVIMLAPPPLLKKKKTLDKGHPTKDLRIFCHHIWQNINRKSMFC